MRIWEQGLVATYSLPGYKELVLEHYATFQRPDTEIVIHGVRDDVGETAARIAGRAVNYAYLHRFHDTQIIENVRRAEREGFDAVIIGVLQDPGLQVARSVVDIPVIGYGEISMLTACLHGSRFAFVGINPDMDPLIRNMIRDQGLASRAAPTAYMDCGYPDLSDAVNGKPERFLTAFRAAAQKVMREQGVDVVFVSEHYGLLSADSHQAISAQDWTDHLCVDRQPRGERDRLQRNGLRDHRTVRGDSRGVSIDDSLRQCIS